MSLGFLAEAGSPQHVEVGGVPRLSSVGGSSSRTEMERVYTFVVMCDRLVELPTKGSWVEGPVRKRVTKVMEKAYRCTEHGLRDSSGGGRSFRHVALFHTLDCLPSLLGPHTTYATREGRDPVKQSVCPGVQETSQREFP